MTIKTLERALRLNARAIPLINSGVLTGEEKTKMLKEKIFISRSHSGNSGSNEVSLIASPVTRDHNRKIKDFSRDKLLPIVEKHFEDLNPTLSGKTVGLGFTIKFKSNTGPLRSILISTFPAGVHFNFENSDTRIGKIELRRNVYFWMDLLGESMPILPKTNGFKDILELDLVLNASWDRLTSSDPDNWSREIPSLGQDAVTALVVQDFFGGTIIWSNARVPDLKKPISHYRNLIDGKEIDLTRKQFPDETKISKGRAKLQKSTGKYRYKTTREYILSYPGTVLRYERLRRRVERLHKIHLAFNPQQEKESHSILSGTSQSD